MKQCLNHCDFGVYPKKDKLIIFSQDFKHQSDEKGIERHDTSVNVSVCLTWPAPLSENLLSPSGEGKNDGSRGSEHLVIDILPGKLRPLSNLHLETPYNH